MSNNVMDYKKRIKEALFYGAGAKCHICGFNEPIPSLYDFHHINPKEKEFGLNTITTKIEYTLNEVKKCILVCPICHRKIHFNLLATNKELKSVFNEEIFWKKYNELTPQGAHQREIQNIKKPNREELKALIKEESFTSIANKYNVSIASIKK